MTNKAPPTTYDEALDELALLYKRILNLELEIRALEEENAELKRKSCIIPIDSPKVEE